MTINFEQNIGEQLKFAFEHNEEISEEDVRELSYEPDETYSLGSGRWSEHLFALYKSGDSKMIAWCEKWLKYYQRVNR